MHWQFPRVFKNPIYTRKFTEFTEFTDFTTLQTYRFLVDRSRTNQPRGPPAHARGLQHEALRRGGSAASSRSHARTREKRRGGDTVVRRGGDTVVKRGGGACEIRCGGAGLRSCRAGRVCCIGSSGMSPVGWSGATLLHQ